MRMWHDIMVESFVSVPKLKLALIESFPNDVPRVADFQVGYFESNTKRWLVDDKDLEVMYSHFESGDKINLWCDRKILSKEDNGDDCEVRTKKKKPEESNDDDAIFHKLREKHPKIEAPKLRLWAKLIQSGHHDSYDSLPPIPLITGSPAPSKAKNESFAEALTGQQPQLLKPLTHLLSHLYDLQPLALGLVTYLH